MRAVPAGLDHIVRLRDHPSIDRRDGVQLGPGRRPAFGPLHGEIGDDMIAGRIAVSRELQVLLQPRQAITGE